MAAPDNQAGFFDADDVCVEQPRTELVGNARAMMKSWRARQASSRASTTLVSTWMLISMRGYFFADMPGWPAQQDSMASAQSPNPGRKRRPCRTYQIGDLAVRPRASAVAPCGARRAGAWPTGVNATTARQPPQAAATRQVCPPYPAIMREAAGCEILRTCAAALTLAADPPAPRSSAWLTLSALRRSPGVVAERFGAGKMGAAVHEMIP